METRKYKSNEEALTVAKEAVWLAYQAAGGPAGMGIFQAKDDAKKDQVWDQAYDQRDYSVRHGPPEYVSCDYVFGKMMKLRFTVKDGAIEFPDHEPRSDYQAWCRQYKTFGALFDAAEANVQTLAA
jgi:hypothetical protein